MIIVIYPNKYPFSKENFGNKFCKIEHVINLSLISQRSNWIYYCYYNNNLIKLFCLFCIYFNSRATQDLREALDLWGQKDYLWV